MKSFKVYRTSLMLLMLLAAPAEMIAQSDCSQILEHGIFNTTSAESLEKRTRTFVNWLSESNFDTYGEALDTGRKLGFAIDGIPLQIDGHARSSDWRKYQASLQTLDLSKKRNLSKFSQVVNAADRGIVKAWRTCKLNSKGVAHAAIELSYEPLRFTVRLIYDAAGAPASVNIHDFTITPDTATCTPTVNSHTTLEASGLTLNCKRQSGSDAIQITGNTDEGTLLAKLPGRTPPPSVATETPIVPPIAPCTDDTKYKRNIDDKKQDGNQPIYVCP